MAGRRLRSTAHRDSWPGSVVIHDGPSALEGNVLASGHRRQAVLMAAPVIAHIGTLRRGLTTVWAMSLVDERLITPEAEVPSRAARAAR